jgi:hypothetical protein
MRLRLSAEREIRPRMEMQRRPEVGSKLGLKAGGEHAGGDVYLSQYALLVTFRRLAG